MILWFNILPNPVYIFGNFCINTRPSWQSAGSWSKWNDPHNKVVWFDSAGAVQSNQWTSRVTSARINSYFSSRTQLFVAQIDSLPWVNAVATIDWNTANCSLQLLVTGWHVFCLAPTSDIQFDSIKRGSLNVGVQWQANGLDEVGVFYMPGQTQESDVVGLILHIWIVFFVPNNSNDWNIHVRFSAFVLITVSVGGCVPFTQTNTDRFPISWNTIRINAMWRCYHVAIADQWASTVESFLVVCCWETNFRFDSNQIDLYLRFWYSIRAIHGYSSILVSTPP